VNIFLLKAAVQRIVNAAAGKAVQLGQLPVQRNGRVCEPIPRDGADYVGDTGAGAGQEYVNILRKTPIWLAGSRIVCR